MRESDGLTCLLIMNENGYLPMLIVTISLPLYPLPTNIEDCDWALREPKENDLEYAGTYGID